MPYSRRMRNDRYHKPRPENISIRDGKPIPSIELPKIVLELQGGQKDVLLSFSGKDSLATWIFLREQGFTVHPYWAYLLPDLENDNQMLDYYEKYFKTHIIRLPHPDLLAHLDEHFFMLPDQVSVWENASRSGLGLWDKNNEVYEWVSIEKNLVEYLGLHPHTFTGVGVRAADNQQRARMIDQNGALGRIRHYWWAIWDWKLDDVVQTIRKHGLKLSRSYRFFGSTGDNLNFNVLRVYKEYMPRDYEKIKKIFPLVEAEFFRREKVK